jgi:enoyl-CoA hydratase
MTGVAVLAAIAAALEATDEMADHGIVVRTMEVEGGLQLGVIRFARPAKLNAITSEGWAAISLAVQRLVDDDSVRAILLTGTPEAFSAGADIGEFPALRSDERGAQEYGQRIARAVTALREAPVPVVAAVQGLAVGGGVELLAASDVRVATQRSVFAMPIAKLGVTLGPVEWSVLAEALSPSRLTEWLLTANTIDASVAQAWGLIHTVVPDDEFLSTVARTLATVMSGSLVSQAVAKSTRNRFATAGRADLYQDVTREANAVFIEADFRNRVSAFLARGDARA